MIPVQTDEMKDGEPMRICTERYGYLPVDKAAFKGELPQLKNIVPYEPFDFYIKRKLFVHNLGHATCAYLGNYLGLNYIYEAIDDPNVRIIVQNAMLESAAALSGKYGADLAKLQLHITDLLHRFTNTALGDTCARVGGDPQRNGGRRRYGQGAAGLQIGVGVGLVGPPNGQSCTKHRRILLVRSVLMAPV
jgi:mannitol-1-phosphate 5-dehydrogenase